MNLSGNQLTGYLPAALAQAPALTSLDVSSNAFAGPLPPLTSSSQLQNINVGNNQLSGEPLCLRGPFNPSPSPALISLDISLNASSKPRLMMSNSTQLQNISIGNSHF